MRIIFRNGATRTNEVADTKPENIQPPDISFEFVTVNGDRCAANYTHNGSVLQYAPPAVAPDTLPKPAQFLIDVFNDGTIPAAARRDVSQMGLWFRQGERQVALAIWQLLSGGASATAIRNHATNNNITLP